jgi:hypothetical protein
MNFWRYYCIPLSTCFTILGKSRLTTGCVLSLAPFESGYRLKVAVGRHYRPSPFSNSIGPDGRSGTKRLYKVPIRVKRGEKAGGEAEIRYDAKEDMRVLNGACSQS